MYFLRVKVLVTTIIHFIIQYLLYTLNVVELRKCRTVILALHCTGNRGVWILDFGTIYLVSIP